MENTQIQLMQPIVAQSENLQFTQIGECVEWQFGYEVSTQIPDE